jgi:hypothetical protein
MNRKLKLAIASCLLSIAGAPLTANAQEKDILGTLFNAVAEKAMAEETAITPQASPVNPAAAGNATATPASGNSANSTESLEQGRKSKVWRGSIMFSLSEIRDLRKLISLAQGQLEVASVPDQEGATEGAPLDIISGLLSGGGGTKAAELKETHEEIFLNSIVYYHANDWVVWLNGQKFVPKKPETPAPTVDTSAENKGDVASKTPPSEKKSMDATTLEAKGRAQIVGASGTMANEINLAAVSPRQVKVLFKPKLYTRLRSQHESSLKEEGLAKQPQRKRMLESIHFDDKEQIVSFTLHPNQSFSTQGGEIVEGRSAIASDANGGSPSPGGGGAAGRNASTPNSGGTAEKPMPLDRKSSERLEEIYAGTKQNPKSKILQAIEGITGTEEEQTTPDADDEKPLNP